MHRSASFIVVLVSLLLALTSYNQLFGQYFAPDKYLYLLSANKLQSQVSLFADTLLEGRGCGTKGALLAGNFIKQTFHRLGLQPYGQNSFFQSFPINGLTGRNVVGILPGTFRRDEYLVISAHYDHLGRINGVIYPGADDNASGIAVLLQLAEAYAQRRKEGKGPSRSIIFIAYDAKEQSLAGSEYFAKHLTIPPQKIIANLNIDQIGCVLEPPHKNINYALVVGAERLSGDLRLIMDVANRYHQIGLDIDYTFYGSKNFSALFYKLGDQIHLAKLKIPSLLYTSGIHAYTYKPTDLPALLNYEVLQKRCELIYLTSLDLATREAWLRKKSE